MRKGERLPGRRGAWAQPPHGITHTHREKKQHNRNPQRIIDCIASQQDWAWHRNDATQWAMGNRVGTALHRLRNGTNWSAPPEDYNGPGGVTTTGPAATPPPPAISQNLGGGDWRFGWGGGVPKLGGPARDLLLPHAYLQGGCVSGGLGVWRDVCESTGTALEQGKSSECRIFTLQQTTFV